MNGYDRIMKPIETNGLNKLREEMVYGAKGRVLELGAGTGANLAYYDFSKIDELVVTDVKLSQAILNKVKHFYSTTVQTIPMSATNLKFDDQTFDTVVFTLVFCSVDDVDLGLQEVRRVLKDDGKIIFIEHVLPKSQPLKTTFNVLNPPWKVIARGCHLNRDFNASLLKNGFILQQQNSFFKSIGFSGIAVKG